MDVVKPTAIDPTFSELGRLVEMTSSFVMVSHGATVDDTAHSIRSILVPPHRRFITYLSYTSHHLTHALSPVLPPRAPALELEYLLGCRAYRAGSARSDEDRNGESPRAAIDHTTYSTSLVRST